MQYILCPRCQFKMPANKHICQTCGMKIPTTASAEGGKGKETKSLTNPFARLLGLNGSNKTKDQSQENHALG